LFVNHVGLRALLFAVVIVVRVAARLLVPAPIRSAVASQPAWLQIAEAMLLGELGGYLGHRAAHAVPLLWRFHKVHHAITEMDWLASSHLHPFDQAFIRSCAIVPVYALGFTVTTLGAFGVVLTVHAFFLHANVRWTLGPLRWVIGTPHFHHWHHALDPEARDKNFAGLFPAVDWLFGTLHIPERRWPACYGIGEPQPRGYLRQLGYPLRPQATRNVASEPHGEATFGAQIGADIGQAGPAPTVSADQQNSVLGCFKYI
jgi:sterol desaturase/sphingolipid hydroxylase (fatty acid hydroxylase superfamily)